MVWNYTLIRPDVGALADNVQLNDMEMVWNLRASNSGKAHLPWGSQAILDGSGTQLWKRYSTAILAEEDGDLAWFGLCTGANPGDGGLDIEFTGALGWLNGVPWTGATSAWQTNAGDWVSGLIAFSQALSHPVPIILDGTVTGEVGDPEPPPIPAKPARFRGESSEEFYSSSRYAIWQVQVADWHTAYDNYQQYKINWWNAPYVGHELDTLANAAAFYYRESVAWIDRPTFDFTTVVEIADTMTNRRTDIWFEDGINIAQRIDTKDNDNKYANQVLALGSGEDQTTILATATDLPGDAYYQGLWVQYRDIFSTAAMQVIADRTLIVAGGTTPNIDNLVVWDMPDVGVDSRISSLRVGDEVRVISRRVIPEVHQWCRIISIARKPETPNIATLGFERTEVIESG